MRLALILLSSLAAAQTTAALPEKTFEAADVHLSAPGASQSFGFLPGGRVEVRAQPLLRLISVAYSMSTDRITGGPSWIDVDRFDVVAKASGSASQAAIREMLQTLLTERFGLEMRKEDKPQPVFVLTPGKSKAAKEASGEGDSDCKRANEDGVAAITCRNTTIGALAEFLPQSAPGYFNHPVIDQSGMKGTYNFTLRFVGRGLLPPGSEGNDLSLFTSIEKQLGLKVEPQTAPMQVLTVVKVSRTPTENPPGVIEKLGPTPTQFDVAEVKPSAADEKPNMSMSNGRVQGHAIPLKDLIQFAYNVEDDCVRGGEKWLETEKFSITAKTAPTASFDTLEIMLRSLLEERFDLKVHREMQPASVYGLTQVKPKLKTADPSERSTCDLNVADGLRNFVCTNVTMAQFAERLKDVGNGYLDHPVVDLTGLKGSYDFTVAWSPIRRATAKVALPADAGVGSVEPPSGITLFEAVDRQLGLKLTAQKQPVSVVVIDHVNRKPSEN